jgi:hypothetical protein
MNLMKALIRELAGKTLLRGWEDCIETDLKEIEWENVRWSHLFQAWIQYFVNTCHEPSGSIKGGKFPNELRDYRLLNKDSVPWI